MKAVLLEKKGKLFHKIANDFTGYSSFEKEVADAEELKESPE